MIAHASLPLALAAAEALFAAQVAAAAEVVAVAQCADVGAVEETYGWAPVEESAAGEVAVATGADARVGSVEDSWGERTIGAGLRCMGAFEGEGEAGMAGMDIEGVVGLVSCVPSWTDFAVGRSRVEA